MAGRDSWHAGGDRRHSVRSTRAREALGAWYERSHEILDRGYDQWFAPPTVALVEAAVSGADVDETLVRLGAARAHAGYSEIEALSDLAILLEVLPASLRRRLAAPAMVAAFTAGFETVGPGSFPQAAEVGGVGSLKARMAGLYRHRAGDDLATDHALVMVDVSALDDSEAGRGVVVHSTADEIREHFPLVDEIAWLRDGRFAVLVRRHPGVALGLASLEAALRQRPELGGATVTTWLEALPSSATALPRFVRRMVTTPVHEALAARAVAGDPISPTELATALARPSSGAGAPRPRGRRLRLAAWREAIAMVGAGVAALVVAAGVSQIVGPFEGGQIPSVTTVLGGALFAEPHIEDAAPPEPSPPPAAPEAPVVEETAVALAAPQPVAAVTPPPTTPPPTTPPPTPVPSPVTTPTTSPPPPTVAPTPAPEPAVQVAEAGGEGDPCAGLSGRDLRRCEAEERVAERKAEKEAERERRARERRDDRGDDDADDRGDGGVDDDADDHGEDD